MEINQNSGEILGIFSIVFGILYPIIGLILGVIGLIRARSCINSTIKVLNVVGTCMSIIMLPIFFIFT